MTPVFVAVLPSLKNPINFLISVRMQPYSIFHFGEVSTSFANKGLKPLACTSFL
jgi:hypothetical protein